MPSNNSLVLPKRDVFLSQLQKFFFTLIGNFNFKNFLNISFICRYLLFLMVKWYSLYLHLCLPTQTFS